MDINQYIKNCSVEELKELEELIAKILLEREKQRMDEDAKRGAKEDYGKLNLNGDDEIKE